MEPRTERTLAGPVDGYLCNINEEPSHEDVAIRVLSAIIY